MRPSHAESGLLTVEDYRATPEGSRYQLIEGELIMAPAPNRSHQTITGKIYRLLADFVETRFLGWVYVAPFDVYLDEHTVVQPDVLFVDKARANILTDDGAHGVPTLVVEVLSPATAQLDAKVKRQLYARHGVRELWLVDPLLSQIQIYEFARDAAKPTRLIMETESFITELLPGLTLSAAEVFKR